MKIQMRKWNYNTNTGISITSIVIIIIITNPQRYKKENKILKSHNEMETNFLTFDLRHYTHGPSPSSRQPWWSWTTSPPAAPTPALAVSAAPLISFTRRSSSWSTMMVTCESFLASWGVFKGRKVLG